MFFSINKSRYVFQSIYLNVVFSIIILISRYFPLNQYIISRHLDSAFWLELLDIAYALDCIKVLVRWPFAWCNQLKKGSTWRTINMKKPVSRTINQVQRISVKGRFCTSQPKNQQTNQRAQSAHSWQKEINRECKLN